jgi:ABC-type antimicrobial peptide transport system permease subunit
MSTADFKATGSTSGVHLSGSPGLVVPGETLTLQLEASPGLDIERAVFTVVVGDSASAPAVLSVSAEDVFTRGIALLMTAFISGFIPAWLITKQNTLDAILGR